MGYIYKITNSVNNKCHIGKTENSIEKRFAEHKKDAFRERTENRPLYKAMRKYGVGSFSIEEIEEVQDSQLLCERECYWINYFNSFHYGYNATRGGDGKPYVDEEKVINALKEYPCYAEVARQLGYSVDSVRKIAHKHNIAFDPMLSSHFARINPQKPVEQWSKDGKYIQRFESTRQAERWCFENGYKKSTNGGHISECALGKRKTAYTFIWKFAE